MEYTFDIPADDFHEGHRETRLLENDEVAVHVAARLLRQEHAAVLVGRGSGQDVEWLGSWEWQDGGPQWRVPREPRSFSSSS
jgi:hypothetical protein